MKKKNKLKARREETIKIRSQINEKNINEKNIKTIEKINDTKSWFFDKISKIGKPLVTWTKKTKKTQTMKIR